jgi:hypothetical protein
MVTACFFLFCWFAPPVVVPDGAGGYVPFTNSRVMPDGSLRPYDPVIDGIAGAVPDGSSLMPTPDYPELVPPLPEYAYPESYEPPRQAYPPRSSYTERHRLPPPSHQPCYIDGKFIGADNKDCH